MSSKWLAAILWLSTFSLPLLAQSTNPVTGYCDLGGSKAQVSGLGSTNYQQGDIPGCTISVYLHGTQTLATLYADDNNTPLSNPFTAVVSPSPNAGFYIFWAEVNHGYDVVASGGTPPNTYPAPQTIKEVFLGGSGGGGGTPCGILYDIQLNDPLGTFGCDSGIFYENPTTHTANLGTPSVGGTVVVQGPTDGTVTAAGANAQSVLGAGYLVLKTAAAPVTSPGAIGVGFLSPSGGTPDAYTVPPTAPASVGQVWGAVSVSGDITQAGWINNPNGQVSCENWVTAWSCNANAPLTTNDVTPTPYLQNPDNFFMSGLPPAAPISSIRSDTWCSIPTSVTSVDVSCPLSGVVPGDTLVIDTVVECGLGCFITGSPVISDTTSNGSPDTITNIVSCDWGCANSPVATGSWGHTKGGQVTVRYQTTLGGPSGPGGFVHVTELIGTDGLDAHASTGSLTIVPAWQAVTTTNAHDTILGDAMFLDGTCPPTSVSGGWGIYSRQSTGATLAAINEATTGTYTPNVVCNTSSTTVGHIFTWAFTEDISGTQDILTPRLARLIDICADGEFPCPAAMSDGQSIKWNDTAKIFVPYTPSTATGTVTTTGSPSSPELSCFSGSTSITNCNLSGAVATSNTSATTLDTSYRTRSCEVVWGGTGSANALQAGDDTVANNSCFNKIGVTETIIAVYCKSDASSAAPTVTPTFGTDGTGTGICSGALTCGINNAYSSSCTVSNPSLVNGNGIDPAMGSPNGTNVHMLVVYTLP